MDYLVTGGMGFIGRHTVKALQERHPDAQITVVDNLSLSTQTHFDGNVRFIRDDVRNQSLMDYLVGKCRRGVIHLAADSRVLPSLSDPALVCDSAQSNVIGTANILVALAKKQSPIGFVYAGSSTAYGNNPVPQREGDLPSVQSPYSATKLAGELLIQSFVVTFGIQATVLRYFQVYGPGQPTTGAYALVTGVFLRQYKAGEPLTVEGDGSQSRDFVHVTDVARANVMALERPGSGLPINIGSGETHTIQELADLISDNQVRRPARRIDLKATQADITLAKDLLHWTPRITFHDGVADMKDRF